jgi:hypothetical protein
MGKHTNTVMKWQKGELKSREDTVAYFFESIARDVSPAAICDANAAHFRNFDSQNRLSPSGRQNCMRKERLDHLDNRYTCENEAMFL